MTAPVAREEVCADEDVPWAHLTITKVATEQSFTAVGNILHYTIVATNDGGADLAAVTVSDSLVSDLSCAPGNGSALAKGASMTCTATHTVTQADLDAKHWTNTACVDDGAAGAAEVCASTYTPLVGLTLVKTASPTTYSAASQVINYSYLLTNSGGAILSGPFTVTDDKATR